MNSTTNTSLLLGLCDPGNQNVWGEFNSRYRPVLVSFAKRLGLKEADAEDAAQESLLEFAQAYRKGKYDREKGRLRNWLLGIATNTIRHILRKKGKELVIQRQDDTTGMISQVADDHSISELWESQWRQAVLDACLAEVRNHVEPRTMQAFELFVLQELPANEVATRLEITRNAVFLAKKRVTDRMREINKQLERDW